MFGYVDDLKLKKQKQPRKRYYCVRVINVQSYISKNNRLKMFPDGFSIAKIDEPKRRIIITDGLIVNHLNRF